MTSLFDLLRWYWLLQGLQFSTSSGSASRVVMAKEVQCSRAQEVSISINNNYFLILLIRYALRKWIVLITWLKIKEPRMNSGHDTLYRLRIYICKIYRNAYICYQNVTECISALDVQQIMEYLSYIYNIYNRSWNISFIYIIYTVIITINSRSLCWNLRNIYYFSCSIICLLVFRFVAMCLLVLWSLCFGDDSAMGIWLLSSSRRQIQNLVKLDY